MYAKSTFNFLHLNFNIYFDDHYISPFNFQKGTETEYLQNSNGSSDSTNSSSLDQISVSTSGVVQMNPSKRLKLES